MEASAGVLSSIQHITRLSSTSIKRPFIHERSVENHVARVKAKTHKTNTRKVPNFNLLGQESKFTLCLAVTSIAKIHKMLLKLSVAQAFHFWRGFIYKLKHDDATKEIIGKAEVKIVELKCSLLKHLIAISMRKFAKKALRHSWAKLMGAMNINPAILENIGTMSTLNQIKRLKRTFERLQQFKSSLDFRAKYVTKQRAFLNWHRWLMVAKFEDNIVRLSSSIAWKEDLIDAVEMDIKREIQRTHSRFEDRPLSAEFKFVDDSAFTNTMGRSLDHLRLFDTAQLLGPTLVNAPAPAPARTPTSTVPMPPLRINEEVIPSNADAALELYRRLPSSSLPNNRSTTTPPIIRGHYPSSAISPAKPPA